MKTPKPDMRVVLLPVVLVAAAYAGVKALLQLGKSDKRVRAEDQLRQSRARRELRGLPPDHVPGSPRP